MVRSLASIDLIHSRRYTGRGRSDPWAERLDGVAGIILPAVAAAAAIAAAAAAGATAGHARHFVHGGLDIDGP